MMKKFKFCVYLCALSLLSFVFCAPSAQAFTLGETYDQSNWQELEGVAIPSLINWVKKGDFIIQTGKLNFEYKLEKAFLDLSQKNAGKYDIDDKGYIIDKATGKIADYVQGLPFPDVKTDDHMAGNRVAENVKYTTYRVGAYVATADVQWIGRGGMEREVVAASRAFYYQNRPTGPIDNPQNFISQSMTFVVEPMDLRGSVMMNWAYNEDKLDTNFAYVPMLRRIRRTSPASRSDPFLGTDFTTDDAYLWAGKNQTMTWKMLGKKTVLLPFTSADPMEMEVMPDGSVKRLFGPFKIGYQVPGWKGAPWAPVDLIWSPREAFEIEAMPVDPYYNCGKLVYYVDKESNMMLMKVMYTKSGEYWKTLFMHASYQVASDGRVSLPFTDGYCAIDDKIDHATYARISNTPALDTDKLWVPLDVLSPKKFNLSALQQLTK
jgi:hypothetical protein